MAYHMLVYLVSHEYMYQTVACTSTSTSPLYSYVCVSVVYTVVKLIMYECWQGLNTCASGMDVRRSLHVRRFTNPEGYICRGGGVGSHVHTYVINLHHVHIHRTRLTILPSLHIIDVHTVLSLWSILYFPYGV